MSLQTIDIQDLVQAQLYESEEQVVQDALRHLLLARPDLRIQVAIYRYRTDPTLSLAQSAAIAGVSSERMKELLARHNVPLRLGPEDIADTRAEVAALETRFDTYSESLQSAEDFWVPQSLDRLANFRCAPPVADISSLRGDFWPEDESADDFITYIYQQRHEDSLKDY